MVAMLDRHTRAFVQWLLLGGLVGVVAGLSSALFLILLDAATRYREAHEQLIFALPLAGLAMGFVLERWGAGILGGNNLVIDAVHADSPEIPFRMAPMALGGTLLTHLFGGSAGREGTAVQISASLADAISHRLKVSPHSRRQLLAAGVAGGFGAVFGTPVAGAIFGLEVVLVGRLEYDALVPALVAATVGDLVTRRCGVRHTDYPALGHLPLELPLLGKWILVGLFTALTAVLFVELTHGLKKLTARWVPSLPLRMAAGGVAVVALWQLSGTSDYLGLGVPMILRAFHDPSIPAYAFLVKLVFTAVTLGFGFMGGEVTPLFLVGALLGNALAGPLGLPLDLAAGVTLAALFGAAANTPFALAVMAVEIMGANALPHALIVAVVAYLFTGHRGIYPSQRIARLKDGGPLLDRVVSLRELDE